MGFGVKFYGLDAIPSTNQQKNTGLSLISLHPLRLQKGKRRRLQYVQCLSDTYTHL